VANPRLASLNLWNVTIIKKHLVGITGLLLVGFLLGHVTGNFLLFVGPEAYNKYGHAIVNNPIYPLISWGLVFLMVLHAVMALVLAWINKKARPTGYVGSASGPKATSLVHRSLPLQGVLFIAFIVLHLLSFKFGPIIMVEYQGVEMRDLFTLVYTSFQDPLFVAWYVFCLLILALHTGHGFTSSFQTLGFLSHPKYKPGLDKLSKALALYVSLGFIIQPLYMFFIYKG
jgi:succinate dehydrogenase / fumarate reductase, cytochrome b subunit